jgi:Flp pilus assembly CpaF family ATPase
MVKQDPPRRVTMDDLVRLTFGSSPDMVAYMEAHHREDYLYGSLLFLDFLCILIF